jgi:hypothetical protein
MAAYAPTYIVLGSLVCRTYGIDCTDWSALLRSPKRGQDRIIPQQAGVAVRPRFPAAVRAGLPFTLNGMFNADGTFASGDPHDNVYTLLATLRETCDALEPITLQLVRPTVTVVSRCIVEEVGDPDFPTAGIGKLVVDVTLPDGPLDLSGGS